MRKRTLHLILTRIFLIVFLISAFVACDKNLPKGDDDSPPYNFNATLSPLDTKSFGNKGFGLIRFRQDPDTARIVDLHTYVFGLQPHHSYLLQRAVNPVTDPGCTSTAWLTLGLGLVAQDIETDGLGNGHEDLWRDVTAAARGTTFHIHFQIIDAVTLAPVLTSDCNDYTVR
ncbi:MAG TPA: hypothetical protein VII44_07535 [Puia sp.]